MASTRKRADIVQCPNDTFAELAQASDICSVHQPCHPMKVNDIRVVNRRMIEREIREWIKGKERVGQVRSCGIRELQRVGLA